MAKVLAIWEEVPETTRFYVREMEVSPTVAANFQKIQGCYINLENSKEVEDLLNLFSEEIHGADWQELDKSELLLYKPDYLIVCGFIL